VSEPRTVYLALGSNLGNRLGNLRRALRQLAPQVRLKRCSPVYETAPWGILDQPNFLNMAAEVETALDPQELLALLKRTELELGRISSVRNGPRSIDLDIIFYADRLVNLPELQIPHPRLPGRGFVLAPLADLIPGFIHPGLGLSVAEMLAQADSAGIQPYKRLAFGARTYVMGILNLTPDSFSGDGLLQSADPLDAALDQARRFIAEGADILDIGGESTRPGAQAVNADEELARVLPLIGALAQENRVILSVDTYKARVAEEALLAGADWVNDVWGLHADAEMAATAALYRAPLVLMHNRSKPANAELQARLGGRYVGMRGAGAGGRGAAGRDHPRPRHRLWQDGGTESGAD
jgi:2-amino-4-hydroxy-6-hydroxymethyldihydropteridine diphosphokinase